MTRCIRDACQCITWEICFHRFRWANRLQLEVWTGRAWQGVNSCMGWRWLLLLCPQGTSIYFCNPTSRIGDNVGFDQQGLSPLPAGCVVFLVLSIFAGWLTFTGFGSEFVMVITYVSVSVSSSARAMRSTFVVPLERRWISEPTAHGKLQFNLFLEGGYRLHPGFLSVRWCIDLVYVILPVWEYFIGRIG